MKYYFLLILTSIVFINSFAQKKLSFSLCGVYNRTQYDITKSQNAFGIGIGGKINYRLSAFLSLDIEGSGSFFGGTKETIIINGQVLHSKNGIKSIYTGIQYPIIFPIRMSSQYGFHTIAGERNHGVRQAILVALSKKERFFLRASFDHVFQSNPLKKGDWGFWGYSFVARLF